jgi:hypothetical protein
MMHSSLDARVKREELRISRASFGNRGERAGQKRYQVFVAVRRCIAMNLERPDSVALAGARALFGLIDYPSFENCEV